MRTATLSISDLQTVPTVGSNEDAEARAPHPIVIEGNQNKTQTLHNSVEKHLHVVIAAIICTEFCERLSFYGIRNSLNLFLQRQLGQSKATASFNVALFGGACYVTPLLGGYCADTHLGRYYAIVTFIAVYFLGNLGVAVTAWLLSDNYDDSSVSQHAQSEQIAFWISLYIHEMTSRWQCMIIQIMAAPRLPYLPTL